MFDSKTKVSDLIAFELSSITFINTSYRFNKNGLLNQYKRLTKIVQQKRTAITVA